MSQPGTVLSPGEIETTGFHRMIASLISLAFLDKILCRWVKGVPTNEEARGTRLKRRYFTVIGLSNVKMVPDRHRHALLIIASNVDELLSNVNIDDLE